MKYCVRPSGGDPAREATIGEIEEGLRNATMQSDWKAWPLGESGDEWDTLAELCAFLPPPKRRWYRVRIRAAAISFPRVCPHCLQPADQTLSVESDRSLAGYYLFYTKVKYTAIQVPFCAAAFRRAKRARIIWLIGFFAALAVSLTAASLFKISNESFICLALSLLIPAWIPTWISRTEKFIRIDSTPNGSVAFLVRNFEYARRLATANS